MLGAILILCAAPIQKLNAFEYYYLIKILPLMIPIIGETVKQTAIFFYWFFFLLRKQICLLKNWFQVFNSLNLLPKFILKIRVPLSDI